MSHGVLDNHRNVTAVSSYKPGIVMIDQIEQHQMVHKADIERMNYICMKKAILSDMYESNHTNLFINTSCLTLPRFNIQILP